MCYSNEQQVGWQFALNQVHRFHCRQVHYNSKWLLLTIMLIDDRLKIDELWYESKLPKSFVLQPSLPSTPLVYGYVWLCDTTNIKLPKYFLGNSYTMPIRALP